MILGSRFGPPGQSSAERKVRFALRHPHDVVAAMALRRGEEIAANIS
jgi:hypothetical protein